MACRFVAIIFAITWIFLVLEICIGPKMFRLSSLSKVCENLLGICNNVGEGRRRRNVLRRTGLWFCLLTVKRCRRRRLSGPSPSGRPVPALPGWREGGERPPGRRKERSHSRVPPAVDLQGSSIGGGPGRGTFLLGTFCHFSAGRRLAACPPLSRPQWEMGHFSMACSMRAWISFPMVWPAMVWPAMVWQGRVVTRALAEGPNARSAGIAPRREVRSRVARAVPARRGPPRAFHRVVLRHPPRGVRYRVLLGVRKRTGAAPPG